MIKLFYRTRFMNSHQLTRFSSNFNEKKSKDTLLNFQQSLVSNIKGSFNHIKGTLIEVMAKRMNEGDILKMQNHWNSSLTQVSTHTNSITKNNLDNDQNKVETVTKSYLNNDSQRTKIINVDDSAKNDIFHKLKHDLNTVNEDIHLYHSLLGEQIVDLGYKLIFLTNVKSLIFIPVWKKQRILRPERAALIAKEKIKNNLTALLNGSIVLYMHRKTKEIGIIDGQHRAAALVILSQQGYWDEVKRNVLLEVFLVDSMSQVTALFREINSAEPVRSIDMFDHDQEECSIANTVVSTSARTYQHQQQQEELSVSAISLDQSIHANTTHNTEIVHSKKDLMDGEKRKEIQSKPLLHQDIVLMINESVDYLSKTYPDMFKPSSRCKPPHVNIDILRDEMFRSEYIQRHGITSSVSLINKLIEANNNEKLRIQQQQKDNTILHSTSKSFPAAFEKAKEYEFYLGLDKGWMYR